MRVRVAQRCAPTARSAQACCAQRGVSLCHGSKRFTRFVMLRSAGSACAVQMQRRVAVCATTPSVCRPWRSFSPFVRHAEYLMRLMEVTPSPGRHAAHAEHVRHAERRPRHRSRHAAAVVRYAAQRKSEEEDSSEDMVPADDFSAATSTPRDSSLAIPPRARPSRSAQSRVMPDASFVIAYIQLTLRCLRCAEDSAARCRGIMSR